MNNLADQNQVPEMEAVSAKAARQEALTNILALGDRQYRAGNLADAVKTYEVILSRIPNELTALNCLSRTVLDQGEAQRALALSEQALSVRADVADSLLSKANALVALGRIVEAIDAFKAALDLRPQDPFAQFNLASCLAQTQAFEEAETAFQKALGLQPRWPEALMGLGRVRFILEAFDRAADAFQKLADIAPEFPGLLAYLGLSLCRAGRGQEALPVLEKAMSQTPDDADLLSHAGTTAMAVGRMEDAEKWLRRAVELVPDAADHRQNYMALLKHQVRYDDLEVFLADVLARHPDDATGHMDKADVLLRSGRFEEGWAEYQWRFRATVSQEAENTSAQAMLPTNALGKSENLRAAHVLNWFQAGPDGTPRPVPTKLWNGQDLKNKSILVYGEQGVGDEVMFASLLPELMALGPANVYLTCDPRLESLFARAFPTVHVKGKSRDLDISWISNDHKGSSPDFYLPVADLGLFFRKRIDDFKINGTYLQADERRVQDWQKRVSALGHGLKIGISWRGGSDPAMQARRSIGFEFWSALAQEDVQLINLQYGATTDEIATAKGRFGLTIHDWQANDPKDKLDDLAALIRNLDLVVTADNTTAHFAGALAVPTWVLVDPAWDWRWPDCLPGHAPFCHAIRPFRASRFHQWDDVMQDVKYALKAFKGGR